MPFYVYDLYNDQPGIADSRDEQRYRMLETSFQFILLFSNAVDLS